MDSNGAESDWSDPLSISIPKGKFHFNQILNQLLYRIIEKFPLVERFLNL